MMRLAGRLTLVVLIAVAASPAGAQPAPGDLLVADLGVSPGVYAVTVSGKLAATLLSVNPDFPNALALRSHAGGSDLLVAMIALPDRLLAYAPGGTVTTLITLTGGRPNGLAADPDGTWIISGSGASGLLRFDPASRTLSSLWRNPFPSPVNSVAVNEDTGHYGVALFGFQGPRVVEVSRSGALLTTLDSSIRDISSLAWDPATGTYTVTDFINNDPAEFVRLDPATQRITSLVAPAAAHDLNAHTRTQRGTWWLAGGRLIGGSGLHEVGPGGVFLKSFSLPWPNATPSAIVEFGARPLGTSGQAAPGRPFSFHLTSARAADSHKPFALLLSLSSRPGISLPDGRVMDLQFDALVLQSLLGTLGPFFPGSSNLGLLDAGGRAVVRLTLPATFPARTGFRVFAAFATLDGTAPSNIGTVSNTVGFSLE